VRYFTQKYARRMEKQIESIPSGAMKKLSAWHWPGNIRELEDFIERSVILSHGTVLQVPVGELTSNSNTLTPSVSSDTGEREKIIRALKETKGNRTLAAKKIGMSRRTLHRKLHTYHLEEF